MEKNTEKGKTRGNGPLAIAFIDANGKAHKRVTSDVRGIEVADRKTNKTKKYDLDFSDAMVWQLAAMTAAKRVETYVRNTLKNTEGASVLECADSVIKNLKEGKIYTRAEGSGGGAAGRPFDYAFWREVMINAGNAKGHKLSDKQLDGFEADLKARSPKERHKHVLGLQKDPHIKVAVKKLQTKRAEAALKKGAAEGEFNAFEALGF